MAKTLADAMREDATAVFLDTREFAQCVLRFPAGNQNTPISVTGTWTERPPQRSSGYGDKTKRVGVLVIADTVTVDIKDLWEINESHWAVETLDRLETGWRHLSLIRAEKRLTSSSSPELR